MDSEGSDAKATKLATALGLHLLHRLPSGEFGAYLAETVEPMLLRCAIGDVEFAIRSRPDQPGVLEWALGSVDAAAALAGRSGS